MVNEWMLNIRTPTPGIEPGHPEGSGSLLFHILAKQAPLEKVV